jgi:predicted TIM-barrel fold metal-dependent hydrolase
MVEGWLDRDARLRASIVIPVQNVAMAVDEIERRAADPRFVQVLFLAMGEQLLGRRQYWPIYAAAEKYDLAIGIHAGSSYRYPLTAAGSTSYYTQDYVAQAQAFQSQLTSMICEGVFSKHPRLRVVMIESGFTWLPSHLTRLSKFWRGLRMEVPWVDRSPFEIVRSNVRFTLQPLDAPPDPAVLASLFDQLGSDELLLFSSDYPHWQYDETDVRPDGLSPGLLRKICVDNPLDAYPRLRAPAQ